MHFTILTIRRDPMTTSNQYGHADLHTHILPGVDDGARELEQAMVLVRMAYADGTRHLFLTPHYRGKYRRNGPQRLRAGFAALQQLVSQQMPDMNLYLGNEIHWEADAPDQLDAGQVLSLHDSGYCLLEFHSAALRSQVLTGVAEMVRYGYTPIIAHAERYEVFRRDRTLTEEVLAMGALIQLNADSILGGNGWGVKRFCHSLLKKHQVHFVASDAHDAADRPPLLSACIKAVAKKYGQEYTRRLFLDNARAVIENIMLDEGE